MMARPATKCAAAGRMSSESASTPPHRRFEARWPPALLLFAERSRTSRTTAGSPPPQPQRAVPQFEAAPSFARGTRSTIVPYMRTEPAATASAEPTSCFFEAHRLNLHYLDWGGDPRKRTFVLLHGGAAHAHWWDLVAPQLAPFGRVVALDFRGHGMSQWTRPPQYGPRAYVEELRALIEHLGTRPIVVGHSMGGAVAQWAAVLFP